MGHSILTERLTSNAEHLMGQYPTANALLQVAIKEAVPWAMPLVTRGAVPDLPSIERLATQLLAILMASEPEVERPVKGFKGG